MMLFLLLVGMSFAQTETVFRGDATIVNGIYDTLEGTELVLRQTEAEITICGRNIFSGQRIGKIAKKWERWGKYLHVGRTREGVFENNRLEVLRNYRSTNGPETQRITLVIGEGVFVYSFKDSQVGGFEVEGNIAASPSPELRKLCY
jgi:hypothetical protein